MLFICLPRISQPYGWLLLIFVILFPVPTLHFHVSSLKTVLLSMFMKVFLCSCCQLLVQAQGCCCGEGGTNAISLIDLNEMDSDLTA